MLGNHPFLDPSQEPAVTEPNESKQNTFHQRKRLPVEYEELMAFKEALTLGVVDKEWERRRMLMKIEKLRPPALSTEGQPEYDRGCLGEKGKMM